ncbi:MAG: ATP-binding cassette domain-containing protein, partial [Eubacteriales bacterium]|nr:ATP-binding cassette domain-containing protein [Eubacteriales bacterium]
MIILSATGITKAYGINPILTDISFHVNQGDKIGIVGDNGAGKTTLLSILSGELPFDGGDFFISQDTSMGVLKQRDNFSSDKTVREEMLGIFSETIALEQTLSDLSHEIAKRSADGEDVHALLHRLDNLTHDFERKNGYTYQSEIKGILSVMAFPEEYFEKQISTLSGGERTRLALASLLLKKPDLLLLDEPTNHLDIGTLKWLEQFLKAYNGTVILISHDRYFLDQATNRIFEVRDHRLTTFEGNYSTYLTKKRQRDEDAMKQYEQQKKEIERQEEIIRRFKQHGTEKLAKRAKSREHRLEHVELSERPHLTTNRMRLHFKEKFQSGTDVLYAEHLSKGFMNPNGKDRRLLFQNVDFDIKRGERICLVGPNGIGKTTL